MKDVTNSVNNNLFTRPLNISTDEFVFKSFLQKNKNQLEFNFFKHNMVCAWNLRGKSDDFYSELLYVKSKKENEVKNDIINQIFQEEMDYFAMPSYEEYKCYVNKINSMPDIMKNVVEYLTNESKKILEKDIFNEQIYRIMSLMKEPFKKGIYFNYDKDQCRLMSDENLVVNVEENKLAYMGNYFFIKEDCSLKKLLGYKILEKAYGANEVDSVYFPLRAAGRIYTGISSYVMGKRIFLTGILAKYNQELFQKASVSANEMALSDELFKVAKRRVVDDIKFVAFQYGEVFAILPYIYSIKREVSMQEINKTIEKLEKAEVETLISKEMRTIAMGVMR